MFHWARVEYHPSGSVVYLTSRQQDIPSFSFAEMRVKQITQRHSNHDRAEDGGKGAAEILSSIFLLVSCFAFLFTVRKLFNKSCAGARAVSLCILPRNSLILFNCNCIPRRIIYLSQSHSRARQFTHAPFPTPPPPPSRWLSVNWPLVAPKAQRRANSLH